MKKAGALRPETKIVEAGFDPRTARNSVKPPIYMTSTFLFDSAEDGERFFADAKAGKKAGLIYSRIDNPNLQIFEERLKVFDGAEEAAAFNSGMSAVATSVFAFHRPESYILYCAPVYGGTEVLFEKSLPTLGMRAIGLHAGDDVGRQIKETVEREGSAPSMIFLETPANPSIQMTDIEAVVQQAHDLERDGVRPIVAIDNTFLGPIFQKPIQFGVDLVIYSTTKFIGGHSDMVGGAVVGRADLMPPIRSWRGQLGTHMTPYGAWLATRSLETLDLRMRRCSENAAALANVLAEHPMVLKVYYPELFPAGSRQREIYEKQCTGPGALISFDLASKELAFRFLNNLNVFTLAVSLGGNESLAEHPAAHTHSGVPREVRDKIGVGEGMVRLSVGLEHIDDLTADVLHALEHCCG